MVYFISQNLNFSKELKAKELKDFSLVADTEYGIEDGLFKVCVIGLYSKELCDDSLIFINDDITNDFHPIFSYLSELGFEIDDSSKIDDLLDDLSNLNKELDIESKLKKEVEEIIDNGKYDDFLDSYNLSKSNLKFTRKNKESDVEIDLPIIDVKITAHFLPADIFRIGGKQWQDFLKSLQISNYRTLRIMEGMRQPKQGFGQIFAYINGELKELHLKLSDTMYRLPPANKSLDGQIKAFNIDDSGKLNLIDFAIQLGFDSEKSLKEKMPLFAQSLPKDMAQYNAQDLFLTSKLDEITQNFVTQLRDDFALSENVISDTTGSNVSKFIVGLIESHFNLEIGIKKSEIKAKNKDEIYDKSQFLKRKISENAPSELEDLEANKFGIQPFFTVGGLLYSRVSRHPVITGDLGDLDLKSCYATALSNINLYLGQPIINSWKSNRFKPTLKEILEFIKKRGIPDDGWIMRVSGNFQRVNNTLLLSDLRFKPAKIKNNDFNSKLNRNPKLIQQWDIDKVASKNAESCILLKEVKFAMVTKDLVDSILLMPQSWIDEYMNLKVDFFAYYPNDLIFDDINEAIEKFDELPDEQTTEDGQGLMKWEQLECKNNVALKFPICYYWSQLREKRNKLKKAKNPIQEVYKLCANSGFGVISCFFLASFNPVASNNVTAKARSRAWMMTNFLNGFSPITDGTSFKWNSIPLGEKFKDILETNPKYTYQYDDKFESDLMIDDMNQKWIDENYKSEIAKFYDISESNPLVSLFDYELKDCEFVDEDKNKIKTFYFNKYINSGCGNYIKSLDECSLLIDDAEYNFVSQNGEIKARSYDSKNNDLIEWFIKSFEELYEYPFIYEDSEIIKFGKANQLAIKFLDSDGDYNFDEILHPLGHTYKIVKSMKLISRSQFLFRSHKQLLNFESNMERLAHLSKEILGKNDFNTIKEYKFSKSHPVGIGFEILSLMKKYNGDLTKLRNNIQDYIDKDCIDFNASLHNISRFVKLNAYLIKDKLKSMILMKLRNEEELAKVLSESLDSSPTSLRVNKSDVVLLRDSWFDCDDD